MPSTIQRVRIRGGYRFRTFEGAADGRLQPFDIPSLVRLPLDGRTVSESVGSGGRVEIGQLLTTESDGSPPLIATVNGVVEQIDTGSTDQGSSDAGSIVIRVDAEQPQPQTSGSAGSLSAEAIEEAIYRSGACSVVPYGIPTRYNTAPILPADVEQVILYHDTADVYANDLSVLLQGREAGDLTEAISTIEKIYAGASVTVVLSQSEWDRPGIEDAVTRAPGSVTRRVASPRYPQFNQATLVTSVLGQENPDGFPAIHAGVLLIDLQGLLALLDGARGKPCVERTVALHGPGFSENLCLRVRIGTPIADIVAAFRADDDARVVANSVMTGDSLDLETAAIGPTTSALIALPAAGDELVPFASPGFRKDSITKTFLASFLPVRLAADTNLHGEQRPCISCTYCAQVCPVSILPWLLHRYVERDIIDERLVRYGAFRCIDCNLCSYVCPSKIPLSRLIADGKRKLIDEGLDVRDATASRFNLKGVAKAETDEAATVSTESPS